MADGFESMVVHCLEEIEGGLGPRHLLLFLLQIPRAEVGAMAE